MARLEDEPIPVDKECPVCKKRKLLSEFVLAHKSSDKRASICKICEEEKRKVDSEFCCDGPVHTNTCLINKTLDVMSWELDCFLARVQNELAVRPYIIEIMREVIRQDGINKKPMTALSYP